MTMQKILRRFPKGTLSSTPRTYTNHSVSFKRPYTREERMKKLEDVGWNVFYFPSEMITGCDLLSDSGTTTMTDEQWAALHIGDEAYGSNRGYFLLLEEIQSCFGEQFGNTSGQHYDSFLFHQGRAAEDGLFHALGVIGRKQIIPSNGHFDTTAANIAASGMTPVNLFSKHLKDNKSEEAFKGNMDTQALENYVKKHKENIPIILLTITNNTGGGQPVSMKNIQDVSAIAKKHKIPFFFDACRFAENAWFIKQHEKGYARRKISTIVKEMFSHVDGFTISFKKDGLANMGGGLFLKTNGLFVQKYPDIPEAIMDYQILTEGHPTYGGMSGRDLMTIIVGLQTVLKEEYLTHRISQIQYFGNSMKEKGLPVVFPIGGHAVYLDMNEFFKGTRMRPEDFGGISFTALLLGLYGHRACELGYFAFGSYDNKTRRHTFPEINYVRLAVPRLRYERQDLEHVAESVEELFQNRDSIPKTKVVTGLNTSLRHFKATFALS
ncbi:MAG: tryptophanase [Candidatus Levybacteria bacterium]|nr:tryptophanase [Candidatus Levybacteria bacterium]